MTISIYEHAPTFRFHTSVVAALDFLGNGEAALQRSVLVDVDESGGHFTNTRPVAGLFRKLGF